MQDFKNLKVWQKSHALMLDIYRVTESFPKEELTGSPGRSRRPPYLSRPTWRRVRASLETTSSGGSSPSRSDRLARWSLI